MKIDHIAFVVKDFAGAKDFFLKLGFIIKKKQEVLQGEWIDRLTGLQNVRAEYIALGFADQETNLELLCFNEPPGDNDQNISKLNQIGLRHFAITVTEIEKVYTNLKAEGITFISDICQYGTGKKLCYLKGPEGIILELAEYIG